MSDTGASGNVQAGVGYGMRNYMVLIIIFWWVGISSAAVFSPSDIEWGAPVSGTLYRGNTLVNGEYTVKAVQFSSPVHGIKNIQGNVVPEVTVYPMVFLGIYKNGALVREIVMNMTSESYIDPDYDIRISVTEFLKRSAREWVHEYYNPWASVSVQTRAKPELEVAIRTDKTSYTSYDDKIISAKIIVTNSGEAFAENVDVNLDTGELRPMGDKLHQYYYKIDKNTVQSFKVSLVVPESANETSYNLSTRVKGYDAKDLEYSASGEAVVTVLPKKDFLVISKAAKDRIYLNDTEVVKITVSNAGLYDIYNISLNDSLNENFELRSDTPLQWHIPVLKPGQEWSKEYSVKPLRASLSGFTIPAAGAKFTVNGRQFSTYSNRATVVVNGPIIILNKMVNKDTVAAGEDIKVTVSINNIGNIATRAEVTDSLPDGASLVSGQISLAPTFLELNTPQGFSYTIRMNKKGKVELPAAVLNYTGVEYRGATRAILGSEKPVITVLGPGDISLSSNPVPADTPEPGPTIVMPGFSGILAVAMLLFAIALRRR